MKTVNQISKIIYNIDPMGTCCGENQITDEYDDVAKLIVDGASVTEAFEKQFWVDCLNTEQITQIEGKIDAIV